jgi:DNA-binding transcriptional regulator YiaG
MEMKIQKELIDTGFGFPIRLVNVPMIKVRGQWTPQLNYNELARVLLRALAHKPSRLTGNEIKFIRTHFEMTLQAFAKRFCVTHVAVLKWEKSLNRTTSMNWTTEKDIRLFVLTRLAAKPQEFASLYEELQLAPEGKAEPIHLDAKKLAA